MKQLLLLLTLFALQAALSSAGESEKLVFKTKWKGERIALPPEFAPKMKWKGVEEIRFAPGMFNPDAADFFSYVLVFSIAGGEKMTEETIKRETLTYYRGLATSVMKGKGKEVDVSKFKFELEKTAEPKQTAASITDKKTVTQFKGKLDWIEPFATAKAQVLHFELQSWSDPKTKKNYLFVCTSPKKADPKTTIWKEMRKVRGEFKVETK